jgi:hypothetical protein
MNTVRAIPKVRYAQPVDGPARSDKVLKQVRIEAKKWSASNDFPLPVPGCKINIAENLIVLKIFAVLLSKITVVTNNQFA